MLVQYYHPCARSECTFFETRAILGETTEDKGSYLHLMESPFFPFAFYSFLQCMLTKWVSVALYSVVAPNSGISSLSI